MLSVLRDARDAATCPDGVDGGPQRRPNRGHPIRNELHERLDNRGTIRVDQPRSEPKKIRIIKTLDDGPPSAQPLRQLPALARPL